MMGIIKKLLKKKEKPTEQGSEFYHPEQNSNPNFLTDPGKITRLLKNIEEASPLCTISIDGSTEHFSSSILDIQIDSKQIILDELLPKHGNELLISENKLKLSTIFNGIRLAFKLSDINTGSSHGIAYYKAAIPDRIYYPQRRSSPRIQITSLNIPFSGVSDRTKLSIGGYIFDLSRGGLGVNLSNNKARFLRGDTVKNCQINIDDHTIIFDLSVRFVKTSNHGTGRTQIGGYFENISSKNKKQLEYFVASIEREEIRKRKE